MPLIPALTLLARGAYTAGEVPHFMTPAVALAVGLWTLASVGASLPPQEPRASTAGPRTRDVYVSVVDSSGAPVDGLSASDFTVI